MLSKNKEVMVLKDFVVKMELINLKLKLIIEVKR